MRIILFLFIIIIYTMLTYTVSAQYFSINPDSKNIDITFDYPKGDRGWSNPYLREFEILVTNELNTTLTVSVSPSSYDSSYIGLSSSKSSLNIPALSSDSVKITVKIADSATDGGSYSGRVRLTSNFQTEYVNVYVRTYWPPPTLSLSGNFDFGEVAAGKSYSRSFTLKEVLKFKNAKNVAVKLNEVVSIYGATASPSTFYEVDPYGKTITLSFSVKERDVVPGTYTPTISISSTNNARLIGSSLRYTIPKPKVEVSSQSEIFFGHGISETKAQKITISETGSYTPLENTAISFKKLTKEINEIKEPYNADWFNFPKSIEYIAPGSYRNIDIEVRKPEDAPIGRYTWEGEVKTRYAGDKPFLVYFVVQPPGLEEIKDSLTKLGSNPLVIKYPQAENLRKTAGSLLSRDEIGMADIANVISLTNIVIKFLNSMSTAYNQHEKNSYNEAYEEFRTTKEELSELNSIKLKQFYSQESSDIKNSANDVWKELAQMLIKGLEQNAKTLENPFYPDASYAEAKEAHEKIVEICSWLNDNSCMQAHNNLAMELTDKINELISETGYLESEVNRIREEINYSTWSFAGTKLVKNPSKILYFLDNYNKMTENYKHILRNYKLIGKQREFDNTQDKQTALKEEYRNFKLANSVYIIFLGFILILTTWKSIQGFNKYRTDARDVRLSEIARPRKI